MSLWKTLFRNPSDFPPASQPPAAMTVANTSGFTLKLWAPERIIANPTEAAIRSALEALDESEMGPRLLLSINGGANRLQLTGNPRDGFGFDYFEGTVGEGDHFYTSKRYDHSIDEAMKVLLGFLSGTADWRAMVEWKKLKM
jgi:hypothetical protein